MPFPNHVSFVPILTQHCRNTLLLRPKLIPHIIIYIPRPTVLYTPVLIIAREEDISRRSTERRTVRVGEGRAGRHEALDVGHVDDGCGRVGRIVPVARDVVCSYVVGEYDHNVGLFCRR